MTLQEQATAHSHLWINLGVFQPHDVLSPSGNPIPLKMHLDFNTELALACVQNSVLAFGNGLKLVTDKELETSGDLVETERIVNILDMHNRNYYGVEWSEEKDRTEILPDLRTARTNLRSVRQGALAIVNSPKSGIVGIVTITKPLYADEGLELIPGKGPSDFSSFLGCKWIYGPYCTANTLNCAKIPDFHKVREGINIRSQINFLNFSQYSRIYREVA